jgi:hypothetical protein
MTATTRAPKPRRTLTPVDITASSPAFRSGRTEARAAKSLDGVWAYLRIEIGGTPWEVQHLPSGTAGDWYGTLDDARAATADGSALEFVECILAHGRGGHAEQRDAGCPRC